MKTAFDSGMCSSPQVLCIFRGTLPWRIWAEALQFINMGEGPAQILHGSVSLKMQSTCGEDHMPESSAVFTLLI